MSITSYSLKRFPNQTFWYINNGIAKIPNADFFRKYFTSDENHPESNYYVSRARISMHREYCGKTKLDVTDIMQRIWGPLNAHLNTYMNDIPIDEIPNAILLQLMAYIYYIEHGMKWSKLQYQLLMQDQFDLKVVVGHKQDPYFVQKHHDLKWLMDTNTLELARIYSGVDNSRSVRLY